MNAFDEFDPQPTKSLNPFDEFDEPVLTPQSLSNIPTVTIRPPTARPKPNRGMFAPLAGGFNEAAFSTFSGLGELGARLLGASGETRRGGTEAMRALGEYAGFLPTEQEKAQYTTPQKAAYGIGYGTEAGMEWLGGGSALKTARGADKIAQLGRAAGRFLSAQPLTGLAASAFGYGTTEATGNPWLGLAAGIATPFGALAAGKAAQMAAPVAKQAGQAITASLRSPVLDETSQYLLSKNIPLTPGQITGSVPFQALESAMANLLGSSGKQRKIYNAIETGFTRAAAQEAGLNAELLTPNVLQAGREAMDSQYPVFFEQWKPNENIINEISKQDIPIKAVKDARKRLRTSVDPLQAAEARNFLKNYENLPATKLAAPFQEGINSVKNNLGGVTHDNQKILSTRAEKLQSAIESGNINEIYAEKKELDLLLREDNKALTHYAGQLRKIALDAVRQGLNSDTAKQFDQVRRQDATLHLLTRAMGSSGADVKSGILRNSDLQSELTKASGKEPYVLGETFPELSKLSQAYTNKVENIPNSMTASRTNMRNLLLLGGTSAAGGYSAGGIPGAILGFASPRIIQELYYGARAPWIKQALKTPSRQLPDGRITPENVMLDQFYQRK